MEAYLPIGILLLIGIGLSAGIFVVSSLLGPKNPLPEKLSTYECGLEGEGSARTPFKNRFYLIAVLFLLFDVEAAFFFPWALVYKDSLAHGGALLAAMIAYLAFIVLGLVYVYRKRTLDLY